MQHDGPICVVLTVPLTSQEAALATARAQHRGVPVEILLREWVVAGLSASPIISPYSDLRVEDLAPGDGEPDPLPVEEDPGEGWDDLCLVLQATWDAQHASDQERFAERRRHIRAAEGTDHA